MHKFSLSFIFSICILLVSCTDYQSKINNIQSRIDEISTECSSLNTTAAALAQLVDAVKSGQTVSSFVPIASSSGSIAGFKLYFEEGGDITVSNTLCSVAPSKDGDSWYWKNGDAWITDSNGNRIEVSHESGALQFKQEKGALLYSTDSGRTWLSAGSPNQYLLKEITEDADSIQITLADGSIIDIEKSKKTSFSIELGDIPESITSGSTVEIPYSLSGNIRGVQLKALAPQGWTVSVQSTSQIAGTIKVTAPDEIYEAAITLVADNLEGKAVTRTIEFGDYIQRGTEPQVLEALYDTYYAESCESQITARIRTNLTYDIVVEKDAEGWVIPQAGTKAVRVDDVLFTVKENASGAERTARVTFKSGIYSTSIQIIQDANYVIQTWQPLKFRTSSSYRNQLTISYSGDVATIVTTGSDPYISTNVLTEALPEEAKVLTFEYTSTKRIDNLQIFFRPPLAESNSTHEGALPAAREWKEVSFPINIERLNFSYWGKAGDFLRMDFGNNPDITIQVRNIHFRNATSAELREMNLKERVYADKEVTNQNIKSYLNRNFLSEITEVEVKEEQIVIKGHCNGSDNYYLAEIPPYEIAADLEYFEFKTPIQEKDFTITIDRYREMEDYDVDRLLSSWAIIKKNGKEEVLASHAHYADKFYCPSTPKAPEYKTQKGLAGYIGLPLQNSDLDDMQASSVTVNIPLNHYVSATSSSYYNDYCGKRYYFQYIGELDNYFRQCQARNIVVSAIILVQRTNSILVHPECNGGNYSMPNLTTQESVNEYAALLDYLAKRYGRNGRNGVIHKWIMHNEVDMGTTWTNMGFQPIYRYMDTYERSMRICHNIARCYNEYAEVMGSFTNSWTNNLEYAPKDMLDILLQYSEAEGDFKWGVAYHSYPQSLVNPKTWNDSKATYTMNTAYISFKNLEVIDKWIKMPEHKYQHTTKRGLWLSENGANTASYNSTDLKNQAACAAWALYKVSQLDGIDAITWHNWCDNATEGVNLGLRKSAENGYEPKPAYYVYNAGMTDDWEEAFEPYLSVIGINSWDEIMHTVQ